MSPETRLKLGVALLILGLIMPAGTLAVAGTNWPLAVKTVLSSILLFGFEIMIIPAVALMGKDNFDRIDANSDGFIDEAEMRQMMQRFGAGKAKGKRPENK